MPNFPRLHGPGVVDRDGRLAKWFVDFLESLGNGVSSATTTADAAAASAAAAESTPPVSITGPGVTGSAESGYQIESVTDPLACQIFGG